MGCWHNCSSNVDDGSIDDDDEGNDNDNDGDDCNRKGEEDEHECEREDDDGCDCGCGCGCDGGGGNNVANEEAINCDVGVVRSHIPVGILIFSVAMQ